jgi:putative DNA methylase
MKAAKKLIEVALPLEAINKASAHEKMPGIGPHPRGLHLWWARRPLATARAVIFAQMVDDASAYLDVLRGDPKLRRKAETALKGRLKLWEGARALAEKAKGSGLPVAEPGPAPTLDDMMADLERQRLFRIIEDLVLWENTTDETVLQAARDEIWQSWRRTCAENSDHPRAKDLFDRNRLPDFNDPFAGGGALPLEAQRLGLESYASDLNPVAVLINKAMIEIPPKFAGTPPANPEYRKERSLIAREWKGAQGLAEDVRYYGQWIRDEAEKRIGHFYPKIAVTAETAKARPDLKKYVGQKLTVIAWIWVRTVKSPNPAFAHVEVPLASTFMLANKVGKEAYVQPVIEKGGYQFSVRKGKPKNSEAAKNGTKLSRGANFQCLMSGVPISGDYIKAEGKAGRMGARLMAIVAEGDRERVYLAPTPEHEAAARKATPEWKPDLTISGTTQYLGVKPYGMSHFSQLFTDRQLVALTTLSDLVGEARERIMHDSLLAGMDDDLTPLRDNGMGAAAYAEAVEVYLAFALDRCCDFGNSCTRWVPGNQKVMNLFGKQAIGMTWDFAEAAILESTVGGFVPAARFIGECINKLPEHGEGFAAQQDAMTSIGAGGRLVSTDPPYFDNVPYADLSDFFYVWLRRSLRSVFPDLFATVAVPKAQELVAFAYRHDEGKVGAEAFFLSGMTQAMQRIADQAHPAFPVTIYYAFKQSESDGDAGTASTGWETFLDAVIRAGFAITGTWPMRSEQEFRMRGMDSNALASSIVLVCRKRAMDAPSATRREFVTALKMELPVALAHLQHGNTAPVDLAQAAIGPGMAAYTRYAKVLDAQGSALTVREALALINQTLDEALAEQEGDFDAESRWAVAWFSDHGFAEGPFGDAHTYFVRFNTAENALKQARIIESGRGVVRLFRPDELSADWDPAENSRLTAWEIVHHLIRVLASGGEDAAAELVTTLGVKSEIARELAYRLYTLCERKKRPAEALAYNGLVQSWPEIARLVSEGRKPRVEQVGLFAGAEE